MRYTRTSIHKLYKQLMSQKCKSHTDVTVWTKNGMVAIPEFVTEQGRNIQAMTQQSNVSEDDAYFSEDNDREDKSEDSGT